MTRLRKVAERLKREIEKFYAFSAVEVEEFGEDCYISIISDAEIDLSSILPKTWKQNAWLPSDYRFKICTIVRI